MTIATAAPAGTAETAGTAEAAGTADTTGPPRLDVADLPAATFGSRDPLWWGVIALMAIEGTVFLLLLASYFYLRDNVDPFPPSPLSRFSWWMALINTIILIATVPAIHHTNKSSLTGNLRGMRLGLLVATCLSAVFIVVRIIELSAIEFRWDSHAYGSLFWILFGLHTGHMIAGTVENALMLAVTFHKPVEEKHLVDINVSGLYWYFVVAAWIPTWIVLFLDPEVFR